jgi:hypothetical protein
MNYNLILLLPQQKERDKIKQRITLEAKLSTLEIYRNTTHQIYKASI